MSDTRSETKYHALLMSSIAAHKTDQLAVIAKLLPTVRQRFQLELIHDQLPLAVPCYDLVLVIELTVGPN